MDPILQTIELTKSYQNTLALDHVSITVNRGDVYGLIGKNGAGKTTLMKAILGITDPTAGEYRFNGNENPYAFRKKIGAIIEKPALYMQSTVYENISRYAVMFGGDKKEIHHILELVDLSKHKNKKARELSLGMKQRLGLGISLLGNPEFLILDEPVNGLDPTGIIEIRNLILKLNQTRNTTILVSSHLLDELGRVATRYAILDHGKLVEEIAASDLIDYCQKKIILHVDNAEKAALILKDKINAQDISVSEDTITISSHIEDSALINKLLCDRGIAVSQLIIHAESLEQYFMRKVGE